MVKLKSFLTLFAAIVLLSVQTIAQTGNTNIAGENTLEIRWYNITVDSAGTAYSGDFGLENFDGVAFATYPPSTFYTFTAAPTGAAADTVDGRIILQTKVGSTWFGSDSINIANSGSVSLTHTSTLAPAHFGQGYRLYYEQDASSSPISAGEVLITFRRKEIEN